MDKKIVAGALFAPLLAVSLATTSYAQDLPSAAVAKRAGLGISNLYDGTATVNKRKKRDLSANEMMGVPSLGELKGAGKLVAVLDTGFDLTQPLATITDMSQARFQSKQAVQDVLDANGITYGQTMVNNKVVFAYNYADNNDDLSDGGNHGTHVAGIIGANPDEANKEARGVLPESQLVLMKVFRGQGTSPDIYVRALHDAIKMGVDAINCSFGTTAGPYSELLADPDFQDAMKLAKSKGIIVAISAGNEGAAYNVGDGVPAQISDYSTVGTPSLDPLAVSVASQNNKRVMMRAGSCYVFDADYTNQEVSAASETKDFVFADVITNEDQLPSNFFDTNYPVEYCGLGKAEDFDGKDLTGKIALIDRGEITFAEKSKNAQAKGAVAVVIVNYADTALPGIDPADSKMPIMVMDNAYGKSLEAVAQRSLIHFSSQRKPVANPELANNILSDFSSWGTATDVYMLRPDVTAPGGDIYSTLGQSFGNESGTSMASPNLAAASLYIRDHARQYATDDSKLQDLTLQFMMSYAEPQKQPGSDVFISPRKQGAGLVRVDKVLAGEVVLNNKEIGRPSILLNKVGDKLTLNFEAINFSDNTHRYDYEVIVQKDQVVDGKVTLLSEAVKKTPYEELVLDPHQTKDLSVEVDVSDVVSPEQTNGFYIDGYVWLHSKDGSPDLHLPFTAFKGDYITSDVFEKPVYDLAVEGKTPVYWSTEEGKEDLFTALLTTSANQDEPDSPYVYILGDMSTQDDGDEFADHKFDKTKIAISPNGDDDFDELIPQAVLLRNSTKLYATVAAKSDPNTPIKTIAAHGFEDEVYLKNYSDEVDAESGISQGVTLFEHLMWDGTDDARNTVPDGDYIYTLHGTATSTTHEQKLEFPVKVDTRGPNVEGATYDDQTRIFTVTRITDHNGSGLERAVVSYEDAQGHIKQIDPLKVKPGMKAMSTEAPSPNELTDSMSWKLPDGVDTNDVYLTMVDAAQNYRTVAMNDAIMDESAYGIIFPDVEVGDHEVSVTYHVYNSDGTEIPADQWKNLGAQGTYRITAESAEKGYRIVAPTEVEVTLTPEARKGYPVFKAEKVKTGRVNVTVDTLDAPLPLTFEVVDPTSGKVVKKLVKKTADATLTTKLEYGDYVLRLKDAPEGYTFDEVAFTVKKKTTNVAGALKATPKPVAVSVTAAPEESTELKQGTATLVFTNTETQEKHELALDLAAEAQVDLLPGSYAVELKDPAPEGYDFELKGLGEDNTLTVEANKPVKLSYLFKKQAPKSKQGTPKVELAESGLTEDQLAKVVLTLVGPDGAEDSHDYALSDLDGTHEVPAGVYTIKDVKGLPETHHLKEKLLVVGEGASEHKLTLLVDSLVGPDATETEDATTQTPGNAEAGTQTDASTENDASVQTDESTPAETGDAATQTDVDTSDKESQASGNEDAEVQTDPVGSDKETQTDSPKSDKDVSVSDKVQSEVKKHVLPAKKSAQAPKTAQTSDALSFVQAAGIAVVSAGSLALAALFKKRSQ